MAQVTAQQRKKTKQRTGDSSYPMETAAQIRSAIKLRHHGKSKSAGQVLSQASSAVSRLLKAGKISASTAERLRAAIAKAREKDRARRESYMAENEIITLEATIQPTGKEWEVTIIGAHSPDDLMTVGGRKYIVSDNGRLYDTKALADSVGMWDGVKVYDNHLTEEEFHRKQGMRSPATEWLGTIVKPRWDDARAQLRGVFKVVEERLAAKLKTAHDQGILSTIGLSIDTFPILGQDVTVEGQRLPVIEGFKLIRSVDLVADPAAGGQFERLIAAKMIKEIGKMEDETKEGTFTKEDVESMVSVAVADALAAKEAETEIEDLTDDEVIAIEEIYRDTFGEANG